MPKTSYFSPELFKFLRELKRHNNREWFQANKWRYEQFERDPFLRFIEAFRPRLSAISPNFIADAKPSGGSLLRIYRDMRFSKGQSPYQTMAAARFPHRAWKEVHAPGLYLHLEPQRSFLGAGLWHPDPDTLMRKDFMTVTSFTEKQVCAADFLDQVVKATRAAGSFLEFLTRAIGLPWGAGEKAKPREILGIDVAGLK